MNQVAVITRTKDRPLFLRRALDSVCKQNFTDYIHIIVNDGGDELSVEAAVAEMDDDSRKRVVVFHRKVSSNAPDTIFNESIDKVNSKYFAIHDDDDTWHAEFLERTTAHLEAHEELGAVVVRADKIDEVVSGDTIRIKRKSSWMPDIKVISLYRQCIDNQFTPIATLFRREAYEEIGKFDNTLPVTGDWEFGVRLLQQYDADFIDPGFALANYHHRVKIGLAQDAVSSHDKHRYYTNIVMNRYLREELKSGQIGVGYIMSQLKYNQSFVANIVKKILPASLATRLKRRVGS